MVSTTQNAKSAYHKFRIVVASSMSTRGSIALDDNSDLYQEDKSLTTDSQTQTEHYYHRITVYFRKIPPTQNRAKWYFSAMASFSCAVERATRLSTSLVSETRRPIRPSAPGAATPVLPNTKPAIESLVLSTSARLAEKRR